MKLFVNVRSIFSLLLLTGLVVGLQACSGGGGTAAPVATDQNPNGIYTTGTLTVDPNNANTTYADFVGMVYNNKFMLFSKSGYVLYDGTVTSITLKDYTATVDVYKDGTKVDSGVSVTGTITNEKIFTGTLAGGNNASSMGSFSLTFDTVYNRAASKADIGNGADFVGDMLYSARKSINTSIDFRVTDTIVGFNTVIGGEDCGLSNGVYTVPAIDKNIYQITNLDVVDGGDGNCVHILAGYTGLATMMDKSTTTTNDRIFFALTNSANNSAMFAIAER